MEFWEKAFSEKQKMWGENPANSVAIAKTLFQEKNLHHVLIPGCGYGRNAQVFLDAEMQVTGIEISLTAIEIAKKYLSGTYQLHHSAINDFPFESTSYDAVFCHGLLYLLDENQRQELLQNCFSQLDENGWMIFTVISKKAKTYGQGELISPDRFKQFGGVTIYFYDENSIKSEFSAFGLIEIIEIEEDYPFYLIQCQKKPN